MSGKSAIEWTDSTWNPTIGCTAVSPGCQFCYAERLHNRRHEAWKSGGMPNAAPQYHLPFEQVQLKPERLEDPLHWRAPRRVFVNSVSDLFHKNVPFEFIEQVFAVMAASPQHVFQVLTKRPGRMKSFIDRMSADRVKELVLERGNARRFPRGHSYGYTSAWPLPNVWLGTSIELDRFAWRAKVLAEIPAAVRFISAEPLLGPLPSLEFGRPAQYGHLPGVGRVELASNFTCDDGKPSIHWLIVGGESGGPPERQLVEPSGMTGWRVKPTALVWVRDLRDRANAAGVAYFFKQWGGPSAKSAGAVLDGVEWREFPT